MPCDGTALGVIDEELPIGEGGEKIAVTMETSTCI
jgi:hypothetical protein